MTAKKQEKEKGETRTIRLPVELTTVELVARAKSISRTIEEKRTLSDRLDEHVETSKAHTKSLESQIEALDGVIADIARCVRTGREDRDVQVFDEFEGDVVLTKRVDTNEVVSSRGMTEAERQRDLFKGVKPKPVDDLPI
jgi:hypothetical protein